MQFILPEQYKQVSTCELLSAAARGQVAFDHRLLRALLDGPAQTITDIVRFANEPQRAADRVDLGPALEQIFAVCPAPEALPFLLARLSREEEVPESLVIALSRLGVVSVSALIEAFENFGPEAGDIPFVLAAMGVRDARIVDTLIGLIDDDPEYALFCLDLYGGREVEEALRKKLGSLPAEQEDVGRQIETVIAASRGDVRPAPFEEFNIWENFPEEAEPDLGLLPENELFAFLDSPSAGRRQQAAECFADLPELSPEQRSRLLRMARGDADPRVRGACWHCLHVQAGEPSVVEEMRRRFADTAIPREELEPLLYALAGDAYDERVRQRILQLYEDPESRGVALGAMWRSNDPQFADYFSRHLDDDEIEVCRQAILGVGFFGLAHEAPRLVAWFKEQNLREDALFAYALVAPGLSFPSRAKWFLGRVEQAGGRLSYEEESLVKDAIDLRLQKLGFQPVFEREDERQSLGPAVPHKVGRNEPCPCGSGRKYKKCCGV